MCVCLAGWLAIYIYVFFCERINLVAKKKFVFILVSFNYYYYCCCFRIFYYHHTFLSNLLLSNLNLDCLLCIMCHADGEGVGEKAGYVELADGTRPRPALSFHPLETLKKIQKLFGNECLGDHHCLPACCSASVRI